MIIISRVSSPHSGGLAWEPGVRQRPANYSFYRLVSLGTWKTVIRVPSSAIQDPWEVRSDKFLHTPTYNIIALVENLICPEILISRASSPHSGGLAWEPGVRQRPANYSNLSALCCLGTWKTVIRGDVIRSAVLLCFRSHLSKTSLLSNSAIVLRRAPVYSVWLQ